MHLTAPHRGTARGMSASTKTIVVMKLILIMLCTCLCVAASEVSSQSITFTGHNASARQIINVVEKQTGVVFIYDDKLMAGTSPISVEASNMPVREFLSKAFADQPFTWLIENQTVVLKRRLSTKGPSPDLPLFFPIAGIVRDANGNAIKGISVVIKGTFTGTVTGEDGGFTLNAAAGQTLVFSSVEFQTSEINIPSSGRIPEVVLQRKVADMQEVVVNKGYYTESRKLSTGSVSTVSGETINEQPVTNVLGALIGRVPGLEVTQAGGMIGGGFKVRIRGQNSIAAGNNPLFIIDGVPFSSESLGSNQVSRQLPYSDGSFGISPFNSLNPADIASIEVLKDADATAIYGSRGSNGVILITTRKGKAGETKFDLRASAGFSKITRVMEMLSTEEYLSIRKQAFANDGITDNYPTWANDVNGNWDPTRDTDWQKELIGGTAKNLNTQFGVSGGSVNTQFLIRGGFQRETTVFPGDFHYDRGSVLVNINHRSTSGKFRLNLSTSYGTDANNMMGNDLTMKAIYLAPNAPKLYNDDGSLNWADGTWENPLASLQSTYTSNTRSINSNLVIDITLLRNLEFKTSLGYSDYRLSEYFASPSTTYNPVYNVTSANSYAYANAGNRQNWIIEPQLNWKKRFGNSTWQAMVGSTFQHQSSATLGNYGYGFPSNNLIHDLALANSQYIFSNSNSLYKYQAVYGRINYNFADKYLLNATARRDGSSRFSRERQFANFGALGAAWIFFNEPFVQKSLPFLSFGKLRSSYGVTGNDQIGDYQFLNTFSTLGGTNYQGIVGLVPQRLYNPDFGWESNKKLEAALELGFWNDRLFLIAAWYRNRSSNQLVGVPLSGITGFTSIQSNLPATVQNTGWEFELQATIIRSKAFTWSSSLNFSIPRNKLVSFPNLAASSYSNQYVVGQPLTIVKQYHMSGIDPVTGIYKYLDVNGDGQLSAAYDRTSIHNVAVHYSGGINNSFIAGRFQLDLFVQFVQKTGYNYLYTVPLPGYSIAALPKVAVQDVWTSGKADATMQVLTAGGNQDALNAWDRMYRSNKALDDTYYARLKNASLSYKIPASWLKGLQGQIFIQGQNLFTVTDYLGSDPETDFMQNLPPLKTITIGAQLTF